MDLFEYHAQKETSAEQPLAERLRPNRLEDFCGQAHLVGPQGLIRSLIEQDRMLSMIMWGPPGCGKTTLAQIIARATSSHFMQLSAVLSGVKHIRNVIDEAKQQRNLQHKRTILFIDEIHRFNKAQQDAFLFHVESGLITLIGATTENPSFEVIPALLSRCRVVTMNAIAEDTMRSIITRALTDREKGLGKFQLTLETQAMDHLVAFANGDVRAALNGLEALAAFFESREASGTQEDGSEKPQAPRRITLTAIEKALQQRVLRYDKAGEEHYNLISALHKSMRGSDPDAALYWLARMLSAGEDPLFIARRMVRFASEDIGIADPYALTTAMAAMEAFRFLGPPEGELALAQAAVYLSTAPKSNSIYSAYKDVRSVIQQTGTLEVPLHIRNAPTKLMKAIGYGEGYKYAHDYRDGFVPQNYLPQALQGKLFYHPRDRGYEKNVKQRLDRWRAMMHKKTSV